MSILIQLCLLVAIYLEGSQHVLAENVKYCVSQKRNTTFQDVIDEGVNMLNSLILTVDGEVELQNQLYFKNLQEISLLGVNKGTVSCFNHSGVSFYNVTGLMIKNITFEHCGILSNSTSTGASNENFTNWLYPTAVYIEKSSDITIEGSVFEGNHGVGLSIYDPIGTVNIQDCNFTHNEILTQMEPFPGGGGMHIELTCCPPGKYCYDRLNNDCGKSDQKENVEITISGCLFENNTATAVEDPTGYVQLKSGMYQRFGRGGGLILIAEGAVSVNFILTNCTFENNTAEWGGGMLIKFSGRSSGNVLVHNSSFVKNTGQRGGGGVYLQLSESIPNTAINIEFNFCEFQRNFAIIGGGLTFLVSERYQSMNYEASFCYCKWNNNSARYSSAIDLSRTERSSYTKDAMMPRFTNCSFIYNYVTNHTTKIENSLANYTVMGKGTFMTLYFTIVFETYVCFEDNMGSALYLISSRANFSSGISASFKRNHGINGGAISLQASSFITINPNSNFNIHNNKASAVGGAIYFSSIGEHGLHDQTNKCMFELTTELENVKFNFSGNRQHNDTINSVYSSPLNACVHECTHTPTSETLLLCESVVTYDETSSLNIQGPGTDIALDKNISEPFKAFPGIRFGLPFYLVDETKNKQPGSFTAKVISGDAQVDKNYIYSLGNGLKLYGRPGNMVRISLTGQDFEVTFDVKLIPCPPGLYLNNYGKGNKCVCRFNGASIYHMIVCGSGGQKALLVSGYWAGYINSTTPDPSKFYTSKCPLGYCQYDNNSKSLYSLPKQLSKENISLLTCTSTRTGILCGDCKKEHSVSYHSPTMECRKNNSLCKLGWLFYIVSEILPVTVLFVVVILFNIKFTSGIANGFIFYSQVVGSLVFNSYYITRNSSLNILTEIHFFIYRFFNMEFFKHNYLSFCLWKGATTLDIVSFSYITIIYAFLLIIVTVMLMKYCSCCLKCSRQQNSTSYAIHGLSTFLILCYVRCTTASFQILTSFHPVGAQQAYIGRRRVFYSGNHEYFDENHVIYAIPALVCVLLVVIPPPVILLWYPLGPKILQKCGLGESWILKFSHKLVPLHRLQPFFDSFQSCYRDEYRFFSGLYFLYRTSILAAFAGVTGFDQFYTSAQILLIVMLVVHAIAQPYKNWWHNVSDALLIAILSAVNALSSFILKQQVRLDNIAKYNILCASAFQLILVYLPLISLIMYAAKTFIIAMTAKCRRKYNLNDEDELTDFPARLVYSDDDSGDEHDKQNRCKSPYVQND